MNIMDMDFDKTNGLIPAIVQDADTKNVLMLGYMNREAFEQTQNSGKVTFFSRSRQQLWTKGETSGNFLLVKDLLVDCDNDTVLIKATPAGPVCHTGTATCFEQTNRSGVLTELERVIRDRRDNPNDTSYTSNLFADGINKIAQKVGEESVELIIEALAGNPERVKQEAADLLYHFLVLLAAVDIPFGDVTEVLKARRKS